MKRVKRPPEPPTFDARCRARGRAWSKSHSDYAKRPKDYWSEFEPDLRKAFDGLCGYCAMFIMKGQVDHHASIASLRRRKKDELAYEWRNLRYSEAVFNQRKSDRTLLDPFEVQDRWFEIQLPSLQLMLTPEVPKSKRRLAEFTIERLGLRDGEVVVRYRQQWFDLYRRGQLSLDGLKRVAPLVAAAVERDLAKGVVWTSR